MSYYSSPSSGDTKPDKPLTVKCEFNRKVKKVSFNSARSCTYDGLRQKIQQGFSLFSQSFEIKWIDDDKEECFIASDADLDGAISFHDSGGAAVSSRSSMSSYRSRKITLEVEVHLHDDGPNLSDSSSLSSREEFEERNDSHYSFSLNGSSIPAVDDDARTVSSREISGASRSSKSNNMLRKLLDPSSRSLGSSSQNRTQRTQQLRKSASQMFSLATRSRGPSEDDDDAATELGTEPIPSVSGQSSYSYTKEPSVFAKLKREEVQEGPSIGPWLKEQEVRIVKTVAVPAPSDADTFSLNTDTPFSDSEGLFIYAETNSRGERRYTYRSSASDASKDEFEAHVQQGRLYVRNRPFSMGTQSSESGDHVSSGYPTSSQQSSRHFSASDALLPPPSETFTIPPELLIPDDVTDCSECGAVLDSMRYICTTCGEKPAASRAELEIMRYTAMSKSYDTLNTECPPHAYEYPPGSGRMSGPSSSSNSSQTLRAVSPGHSGHVHSGGHHHHSPRSDSSGSSGSLALSASTSRSGYELCASCVQMKGVDHSLLGSGEGGSPKSPGSSNSAQELALARRSAPRLKGELRHAFSEKIWGTDGWQDLEQEFSGREVCSGCQTHMHKGKGRYKCVVCDDFGLCRACYSDVHNIHPLHAFTEMPDDPTYAKSNVDASNYEDIDDVDEPSMKHPDVTCYNCSQDIVGARFHCVTCSAVDICASCETAGLHGFDENGGHSSSHVLLKFPTPLTANEEQAVTRNVRAIAAHEQTGRSSGSLGSVTSMLAKTGLREKSAQLDLDSHLVSCNRCRREIYGVRYQCLSCPSKPVSFNLCSDCERWSWRDHDPMHIFIMLPRPVDNPQPLQSEFPLLPSDLYAVPAGPVNRHRPIHDPDQYLKDLTHKSALCDRHMTKINGRWFRCAYCEESTDLCSVCHGYDTHDPTHAFIVFKAPINMTRFLVFANLESPDNKSPPVLKDPIYYT